MRKLGPPLLLLVALGCSDPTDAGKDPPATADAGISADIGADVAADVAEDAGSVDAGCVSYTDCPELELPACQITACQAGQCVAAPAPDSLACDDDNACTQGETCKGGQCSGGVSKSCNDGNPCTDDVCDPNKPNGALKGACAYLPSGSKACSDGQICTVGDACVGGACKPGKNECQCQVEADCKAFEDGNACNGTLVCEKTAGIGKCVLDPLTVIGCKPADKPCVINKCDPAIGVCVSVPDDGKPCADGAECTIGDVCSNGGCLPGPDKCACHVDADCAPAGGANKCTGALFCDKSKGAPWACAVHPGSMVTCTTAKEDKDCVVTVCEPKLGACVTSPLAGTLGKACDDGDACTFATVCGKGQCGGGTIKDCTDGNLCTADTCKADGTCVSLPVAATCDDADVCTVGEHCVDGKCGLGGALNCDDKNACTVDSCQPAKGGSGPGGKGGCVHMPTPATACDDGDACTLGDRCKTMGSGDKAAIACASGKAKDCEDGDLCTVDEPCTGGVCGKGKPRSCDDGNVCTDDGCLPKKPIGGGSGGCFHTPNALPCMPAAACLGAGKCASKVCKSGKPRLFSVTVDTPKPRDAHAVVELAGGVLLVAGVQRDKPGAPGDSFVARYSSIGIGLGDNILASKGHDAIHGLARIGDGAVAGGVQVGKGGADGWVGRLSGTGALEWSYPVGGPGDDGVEAVAVDGKQIVLAGWRAGAGGKSDGSLWATNDKGALAWQWSGGDGGPDRFVAVSASGQAATAVGSMRDTATGYSAAWIVNASKAGLAWQRRIGGGKGNTAATAIGRLGADNLGGGWMVAGYDVDPASKAIPWVRGVTNRGGVAWKRIVGKAGQGVIGSLAAGERGFIATGTTVWPGSSASADGWVARIGPNGARIGGVFTHSGPGNQALRAATRLSDGGFVAVGSSEVAVGGPLVERAWLLRMDAWGHGSCAASGACVKFTEKGCGGGGCWLATCDKAAGCGKQNLPVPCNDGDVCTVLDRCGLGACKKGDSRTWARPVGGAKFDVVHAVAVMPGGDVVVAGETQSTGKPADGMLVRLTEGGDKRWKTHWGPSAGARLRDVVVAEDGSIVAVGDKTSSGVQSAWLLRIDADGTLLGSSQWTANGTDATFAATTVLDDGSLAVVGAYRPKGTTAANRRGAYRLFDRHGKATTVGSDAEAGGFAQLRDVVQVGANTLVAVGVRLDKGGTTDGLWARIPVVGGKPVLQAFGGAGHDAFHAVAAMGPGFSGKGNTVVVGSRPGSGLAKRRAWITAIGSSGQALWSRTHAEAGDVTLSALAPAAGGWMAAGTRPFDGVSDEAMVLRTDGVGMLRWHHGLGQGTDARSIARLGADYVVAGLGPTTVAKDSGNGWVARTDRWGNSDCHGTCIAAPKTPGICDDKNVCTMDVCVGKTGKCKITPAFDGLPCGGGHICKAGLCK